PPHEACHRFSLRRRASRRAASHAQAGFGAETVADAGHPCGVVALCGPLSFPGMIRTVLLRCFALFAAAGLSLLGSWLFLRFTGEGGLIWLDLLRCALVAASGFWLVWGSVPAVLGVFARDRGAMTDIGRLTSRTAILVPIY